MTIADELKAARSLIDTPEKWVQFQYAVDASGNKVMSYEDSAVRFCVTGACNRVGLPDRAFGFLLKEMDGSMTSFNDTHTHAEVMAAFDRAIEEAESKP